MRVKSYKNLNDEFIFSYYGVRVSNEIEATLKFGIKYRIFLYLALAEWIKDYVAFWGAILGLDRLVG